MIWRIAVRDLKLIVDILRDILLQVWMEFANDGHIRMSCVDPEKVVVVDMDLAPSAQEYKCQETVVFCLYIQSLFKIIRGAGRNEVAVLTIFKDDPDWMTVRITGNDYQEFKIRRVHEPSPILASPPPPQFAYSLKVEANNFYAAIRDLSAVGKVVTVVVNGQDDIQFSTTDSLGTEACYQFPDVHIESAVRPSYSSRYVIKYIEKFAKPGLAGDIYVLLGNNLPLRCEWRMDFGCLVLSVAPLG